MAKTINDAVFDAAWTKLATANVAHVTSAEPANHAGIAAVSLADVVLTPGLNAGDWSAAANGDVSGRKVTLLAQTNFTVDASGTATHVVVSDGTTLLATATCTSQALTAGNTVSTPAFDFEIQDPT